MKNLGFEMIDRGGMKKWPYNQMQRIIEATKRKNHPLSERWFSKINSNLGDTDMSQNHVSVKSVAQAVRGDSDATTPHNI